MTKENISIENLVGVCEELCNSIRLMGEVWCFREIQWQNNPDEEMYINEHWLEHTPQCLADAYVKGMHLLKEYKNG
jgi:hypothetical protein